MPKIHFYVALATSTFLIIAGSIMAAGSDHGAGIFAGGLIGFAGLLGMTATALEAEG